MSDGFLLRCKQNLLECKEISVGMAPASPTIETSGIEAWSEERSVGVGKGAQE